MRSYLVGGAVRDQLLGRPVHDRDYVVVGATPEEMTAAGYTPVGRDFPVFLHPETHEEYALARTERKTAPGYRGFVVHSAPTVTLEEDLARRDLTINAMAMDADGTLIDPYGGARDLAAGVLRHVSPAFVEDPVRILRVGRFAARFGFSVAPETLDLMRQMVDAGEVDALVAERVWAELSRGLMETSPAVMLQVLLQCGALGRMLALPGLVDLPAKGLARLGRAAAEGAPLSVRFALLLLDILSHADADRSEQSLRSLCTRLRAPNDCRDFVLLGHHLAARILAADAAGAAECLAIIERADALRQRERFVLLLETGRRLADADADWPPAVRLAAALTAAQTVDAGNIARACSAPSEIPQRIRAARLEAIHKIGHMA